MPNETEELAALRDQLQQALIRLEKAGEFISADVAEMGDKTRSWFDDDIDYAEHRLELEEKQAWLAGVSVAPPAAVDPDDMAFLPDNACQDGHIQIFYNGDNPDCPLCEAKADVENERAKRWEGNRSASNEARHDFARVAEARDRALAQCVGLRAERDHWQRLAEKKGVGDDRD